MEREESEAKLDIYLSNNMRVCLPYDDKDNLQWLILDLDENVWENEKSRAID